ncbi:DUF6053 domain-containing protein [Lysobacter sp. ISL-52]|uniref:DUF6053 domain-containing protein n=1 Tax=Lysobacter sp. ISL-52 TaxID=2819154 RepID=UPI0031F2D63D
MGVGAAWGCLSLKSFVGGASAPMPFDQFAAIGKKSIGAEAPPTKDFAARWNAQVASIEATVTTK